MLSDFAKFESIAVAVFIANNGWDINYSAAKWRRELDLDELSFLQFNHCVETETAFGEIVSPALNSRLCAAVSGSDLDCEIDLKPRPLPLGRLSPPRWSCGDLMLHDAWQYEVGSGGQATHLGNVSDGRE